MSVSGVMTRLVIVLAVLGTIAYETNRHIQNVDHRYSVVPYGSQYVVMAVGGSNAIGWGDADKKGYVNRAFADLSTDMDKSYNFINKAKPGCGPEKYVGVIGELQQTVHPKMLVMAYGILDDIADKTPISVFKTDIELQIKEALGDYEAVVVTTPPATEATFKQNSVIEEQYVQAELDAVKTIGSNHVYFIDLMNQMKQYFGQSNRNYMAFMANGWHLNTKGHALAGQLLASDMKNLFVTKESMAE